MVTGWVVSIAAIVLLIGATGGFLLAYEYTRDYFKKNPPISENILYMMMALMGQGPLEKKVKQTT